MSQPKFCPVCGTQLAENVDFCAGCGTSVSNTQQSAQPAAPKVKKPLNPKIIKFGIIGVAFIAVIVIGLVIFFNLTKYQKIKSKDLFKVEFMGINGKGKCVVSLNAPEKTWLDYLDDDDDYDYANYLDEDTLDMMTAISGWSSDDEDDSKDKKEYSKYLSNDEKELQKAFDKADSKSDAKDMRDALIKELIKTDKKTGEMTVLVDISEERNLKNGDKIKITVEADEDSLKDELIKLTDIEFEVKVEGLLETEALDVWDGFNISFSGITGEGNAEYDYNNSKYPFVSYDITSSRYDLSNGDKVTVEAEIYNSQLETRMTKIDEDDDESEYYLVYDGKAYTVATQTATKEFEVSGLTELQELDVFEGLSIDFEGADPSLSFDGFSYDDRSSDLRELMSNSAVTYRIKDRSYSSNYKVGDVVTVQASCSEYSFKEMGYKPAGTKNADGYYEKEFTIEGDFGHYLTAKSTADEVALAEKSFESFVKTYKSDCLERKTRDPYNAPFHMLEGDIEEFKSLEKVETYIRTNDEKGYDNRLYNVYKVKVKTSEKDEETYYMTLGYKQAYIDVDGKFFGAELAEYDCPAELEKKDLIERLKDDKYTLTKVL